MRAHARTRVQVHILPLIVYRKSTLRQKVSRFPDSCFVAEYCFNAPTNNHTNNTNNANNNHSTLNNHITINNHNTNSKYHNHNNHHNELNYNYNHYNNHNNPKIIGYVFSHPWFDKEYVNLHDDFQNLDKDCFDSWCILCCV